MSRRAYLPSTRGSYNSASVRYANKRNHWRVNTSLLPLQVRKKTAITKLRVFTNSFPNSFRKSVAVTNNDDNI